MTNDKPTSIYLLAGNGGIASWWDDCLPYFQHEQPVPIELPGMGKNRSPRHKSLTDLAEALLDQTQPGQRIFAVGINALVVLHAIGLRPGHFSETILLAPVGAFLWQRSFVKVMSLWPIRKTILFLLRNFPALFKRKFTRLNWTKAQLERMGEGYRHCRSFEDYFHFTSPLDALDFFEHIRDKITLVWGEEDAVLNKTQLSAWAGILPRADLHVSIQPNWGHYPYIDAPEAFAKQMEQGLDTFPANTKAGRLQLASISGLKVPEMLVINGRSAWERDVPRAESYAVRASSLGEDQADYSGAGQSTSFLQVKPDALKARVEELLQSGVEEVIVQPFVAAKAGGVAFIRGLSYEVEWVHGHPSQLLEGNQSPDGRFIYASKGHYWKQGDWQALPFAWEKLKSLLDGALKAFHYLPLDVEWIFDGEQCILVQARPVTTYAWRRSLTSANLDELLPSRVSKMMEIMQRDASLAIGRAYAAWDPRCLEDHEPFTVVFDQASYINLDLFLSRFAHWGLPSSLLAREIGSSVPHVPFGLFAFLRAVPLFLQMLWKSRNTISRLADEVQDWHTFWVSLPEKEWETERLRIHLRRYYTFIVRRNIHINAALSSDPFSWFGATKSIYGSHEHPYWRMEYESDPATPRGEQQPTPPPAPFPSWNGLQQFAHLAGLPGMGGKYLEVREWFRDENMKVFYHLHFHTKDPSLFDHHPGMRSRKGTFFEQNPDEVSSFSDAFPIVSGELEGILGKDIAFVEVLKAGDIENLQQYKGVVALTGGRLSHGATLLREFGITSAVIPQVSKDWLGRKVKLKGAQLWLLEEEAG